MIKSAALSSVERTLEGMRLAITDPDNVKAYKTSCHAFTAATIRENPDVETLPDDAMIILLGFKGEVLHSILTSAEGEILADTQRDVRKISSSFNPAADTYESRMFPGSDDLTTYEVIATVTVGDFRRTLEA